MPIAYMENDVVWDDLKRHDHLVIALNTHGLYGVTGWRLVTQIDDIYDLNFKGVGEKPLGTVISQEIEGEHAFVHGIVCADLTKGWVEETYEAITAGLDEIWGKVEDTVVRPFKSTWLGRGKMRQQGDVEGSLVRSAAAIANSKAEVGVYYL